MADYTQKVWIGEVAIGGGEPVAIQSMTNTDTSDINATVVQIRRLEQAGCQIIRVAVPNVKSAKAIKEIVKNISIPLVADIHFNHLLALEAIENGANKIRINPGNIGKKEKIRQIVAKANQFKIPIRIGINSGSLEKDILQKEGGPTAKALVDSAMRHIRLLSELGAEALVLSIKSSHVATTIQAYQEISTQTTVPLHIGLTEAGTTKTGAIRSAVTLGILLSQGIGDTIRVSLTGDPVEEVITARHILKSLDLYPNGLTFISCPTCGRTKIDLIPLAEEVENRLSHIDKKVTVALMGCEVNGPGEAKEADIGIACGKNGGVLFKKGKLVRKVALDEIVDVLVSEAEKMEA